MTTETVAKMNDEPVLVDFDSKPDLMELRERLGQISATEDRAVFESRDFAPVFSKAFAELPMHHAPKGLERPEVLISVLGLSPLPVAYMAAWAKPKRMLCIASEESASKKYYCGRSGNEIVRDVGGLDYFPEMIVVDLFADIEIYRTVRDFLRRHGVDPSKVFIDPTGGKKSMSAAATLAGYREGVAVVYVDFYGGYDERLRRPVIGTEHPRYLRNPLIELAEDEFGRIAAAFNRGDYLEASRRANELSKNAYDHVREAEATDILVEGYRQWDNFEYGKAYDSLVVFREKVEGFSGRGQGQWAWAEPALVQINLHLPILEQLRSVNENSQLDQWPLVLNDLACAYRQFSRGEFRWTLLMLAVALERYCLNRLKTEHEVIEIREDDPRIPWGDMASKAKRLNWSHPVTPYASARIDVGFALLFLACKENDFPAGDMHGICEKRNQLAHPGNDRTLDEVKLSKYFKHFRDMLVTSNATSADDLNDALVAHRFPVLPETDHWRP